MEIIAGFYTFLVLGLGIVLDEKKGIAFPVTYSWGVAIALIVDLIYKSTTRHGVEPTEIVMAFATTALAGYITAKVK